MVVIWFCRYFIDKKIYKLNVKCIIYIYIIINNSQAPKNSGSRYCNYKKTNSLVLMAISDANCKFILIDVGGEGRRSDGGIFEESEIGKRFIENKMCLPQPSCIEENGPKIPYFLVGDEAFALTNFMMRPYPRRGLLNEEKEVLNYRICRPRRIIECSFGILSSKFRIFRSLAVISVEKWRLIIQAAVCIHNFILMNGGSANIKNKKNRAKMQKSFEKSIFHQSAGVNYCVPNTKKSAFQIRDYLAKYFCNEGAVPWQWQKVYNKDY